ncbi:MAG: universal stress protein [Desulfobacula sp.]|uniref:universal stress protein n=1 Tax=Desulfobacula sp. TaxID=2593537 RepID=UPI0025C423B4|nr:universal stress protein [Desulfobacula sp.]MCD4721945.1 universal stress protein [Desulfobacula sp.]
MFKNILIPIDIAKESSWKSIFPVAVSEAKNYNAKLSILTVLDLDFVNMMTSMQLDFGIKAYAEPKNFREKYINKAKEHLQNLIKREIPNDIKTEPIVKGGKVHSEIILTSKEVGADLIIIKASHESKIKEYFLGVNSSQVTRYAKCSVLLIRS